MKDKVALFIFVYLQLSKAHYHREQNRMNPEKRPDNPFNPTVHLKISLGFQERENLKKLAEAEKVPFEQWVQQHLLKLLASRSE